jgi:uncharacterized protein (DUF2225 family)
VTTVRRLPRQCPACGRTFRAAVVLSTNAFGALDTDLYRHAAGASPLPHAVTVCPHCDHVDWTDEFPDLMLLDVPPTVEAEALPGSRRYELLAESYDFRRRDAEELGWIYLRGSWCARDEENPAREAELQALALACFEQAWNRGEIEERAAAAYLIGELHRRQGRFDAALEWWERARQQPDPPAWMFDLLAVVEPLAREEIGENAELT